MIVPGVVCIVLGAGLGVFAVLVGGVLDGNPGLLDRGQRKRWKWMWRGMLAVTVVWLVGLGLWMVSR